jgi:energy-coupling factor transporter ATP-binding protein EcfA2
MSNINTDFFELILNDHSLYRDCNYEGYIEYIDKESKEEMLVPIMSSCFARIINILHDNEYGTFLSPIDKKALITYIHEYASIKSGSITINRRFGYMNKSIYIDLCDNKTIFKINCNGIKVLRPSKSRCKFVKPLNALPLPQPNLKANADVIENFWEVFILPNIHHRHLFLVWLLNACYVKTNYPILVLIGEKGSGKSTISKFAKALIDPDTGILPTLPTKLDDLATITGSRHLVVFDNVTKISPSFSNLMCQTATGGTHTKRQLYTDRDESSVDLIGPMILNGVTDFINAEDLLDRCILMKLKPVKSMAGNSETEVLQYFNEIQGDLLGWLINTLQKVMHTLETMKKPQSLPRMADFYIFGLAVEKTLGWDKGSFKKAMKFNQQQRHIDLLGDSDITQILVDIRDNETPDFTGTYKALLELLQKYDKSLSLKPRDLAFEIRRIKNSLQAIHGIEIKFQNRSNRGHRVKVIFN